MKRILTTKAAAMLTFAAVIGFGAISHAQNVTQDFEGGTVMTTAPFFVHDGSGFLGTGDDLTAEGLPGSTAFAGAGGGVAGSASSTFGLSATGGVGGSQAVQFTLFNDGQPGFVFGGVQEFVGVVANPGAFTASVDVNAPAGVPLSLRLESPFGPSNNGFELNFVGTGAFQTITGVPGVNLTPIAGGTFDATAPSNILVATQIGGNAAVSAEPIDIFIDNFSFVPTPEVIPEPSSLALLFGLGSVVAVRRRRS